MTTMEKEVDNLEVDAEQENYVPPAQKSVSEIIAADAEDESLNSKHEVLKERAQFHQEKETKTFLLNKSRLEKFSCQHIDLEKEQLLGEAKLGQVIVDASDPRNVLVKSITLVVDGRPDITMQLDKDHLNDAVFTIKEGAAYRIRFDFHVQREICTGLKYKQKVTRHSITVDRDTFMVGSYAPKMELQSYTTPLDEAPSGIQSYKNVIWVASLCRRTRITKMLLY
uniref:Uncharacterized protein n=1 Tax=Parascaris equorum TaxID=6256 RepID=A0A914RNQ8_PAREQ